jgi:hypothetical protein
MQANLQRPATKTQIEFPVRGPSAWLGRDLCRARDWVHHLTPAEIADLDGLIARTRGADFEKLTRADAVLPVLGDAIAKWLHDIRHGRGFVLVKGVPTMRYSIDEAAVAYWAIGLQLGTPKPQNSAGDLLGHIRDTGEIASNPNVRLYKTTKAQDFHTDGADIIGLLCLKPAKSGGLSRIVSSVSVLNEVARRRADLVPLLFQDFPFDLTDDRAAGSAAAVARLPIARVERGELKTFFIGWYIRNSQRYPDVERLSAGQIELISLIEEIANDPDFHLDMDFESGDIQFLHNATILHARTAYEDFDEPERKRHLLRLWLTADR